MLTIEELKKKLVRQPETSHFTRELTVDESTIDKENMYCEFSVSSEYPVRRWFGYEILDHNPTSIRLGRLLDGAAHRDGHYGDQIGIVKKAWIDSSSKKLRVGVQFSKNTPRAVIIFDDIADGIRKNVSMEYDIFDFVLERRDEENDIDYYRIVDWEPIHTCHTPDGADPNVGNGRSREQSQEQPKNESSENSIKINNQRSAPMTEEEKAKLEAEKASIRQNETDRIKSIYAMADDMQRNIPHKNLRAEAEKFVAEDKSFKDFYDFCSKEMRSPEAVRTPEAHIDAPEKEMRDYSIAKAILAAASGKRDTLGVELEMHKTLVKKLDRQVGENTILIPTNVFRKGDFAREKREQVVGTAALGGNTVLQEVIDRSFIEYLSNTSAFINAGITFIPGMSGNVPFIREIDEHSFSWTPESTGPSDSDVRFSKEEVGPKLGGARTKISRQMLLQSPNVSEAWARRKLTAACRRGIDKAIAYGTGLNNQPFGFKNITGTHAFDGAGFNRAKAIEVRQAIKSDNAELGQISWMTNPVTAGVLMNKEISQGTAKYLWDENTNMMVGRNGNEANQVDEGDLFYAVWASILLLEWGFLEIDANPFGEQWAAGGIDVKALIAMNTYYEYPQSIAIVEGVN